MAAQDENILICTDKNMQIVIFLKLTLYPQD